MKLSNFKKKSALLGVTFLSVITLTACSQDKVIVQTKNDEITQEEFYNSIKKNSNVQTLLANQLINKVLEDKFGGKVTSKDVDKEYKKAEESYGQKFEVALSEANLDKDTYKEQLKSNMLIDYAVRESAKKNISNDDYKKVFENYTPKMTVEIIKTSSENEADTVVKDLKDKKPAEELVEKYDTIEDANKEGVIEFDSSSDKVPTEVMAEAIKLEKDGVSNVITSVDTTSYETSYYVIRMKDKESKSNDWKQYKDKLKDSIVQARVLDSDFSSKVLSKILKEYDVKVKDDTYKKVIDFYLNYSNEQS